MDLVKATCLDLASYLGDYSHDMVVVGGSVPTLLVIPSDGCRTPLTTPVTSSRAASVIQKSERLMPADRPAVRGGGFASKGEVNPCLLRCRRILSITAGTSEILTYITNMLGAKLRVTEEAESLLERGRASLRFNDATARTTLEIATSMNGLTWNVAGNTLWIGVVGEVLPPLAPGR